MLFEIFSATDLGWGVWEEVTSCSVSCGGGSQTLARECTKPGPGNCENPDKNSIKTVLCNRQSCNSESFLSM